MGIAVGGCPVTSVEVVNGMLNVGELLSAGNQASGEIHGALLASALPIGGPLHLASLLVACVARRGDT